MSNHNRGLWGYHGRTRADHELTVQGTGIGGPSAVAVLEDLVGLGVERVIRVGTCRGSLDEHRLGMRLIVTAAEGRDGTSRALGGGAEIAPDPVLTGALLSSNDGRGARVVSSDLRGAEIPAGFPADLQTAAILTAARELGIRAAAILVVTRVGERPLADEPTEAAMLAAAMLGERALRVRT